MTTLDWILVGFIALSALSGYRRGLISTALSFAGLFFGAVIGARVAPHLLSTSTNAHYGALVGLGGALAGAAVLQTVGSLIGSFTRTGLHLVPPLRFLDSLGGLVAGALAGAVLVWIGSSAAAQLKGQQKVHDQVSRSHVIHRLDQIAPPHDLLKIRTPLEFLRLAK